eukprot:scaffold88144_cov30-Tisochrysis_lutea.AAC.2
MESIHRNRTRRCVDLWTGARRPPHAHLGASAHLARRAPRGIAVDHHQTALGEELPPFNERVDCRDIATHIGPRLP